MNVHIVCKEPDETRILRRLAQMLTDQTGWSMSDAPRIDVDLNYFIPYLDWERCTTPTAAWFTHSDANHQHKRFRWQRVAELVDYRTTSTTPYLDDLLQYGAAVKVPPPLDRDSFTIADPFPEFVVGVAGYSYNDNRKGEDLIQRLSAEFPPTSILTWRAIGRGWGIPTQTVPQGQLPAFYQTLSLFVCASRIEGVPYPPLEALACGVPVIIPRGVGLLDDLPDMPGIFRFDAGDYDSLRTTFKQALHAVRAHEFNRHDLRAATEPYTPRAWAEAHERAFEEWLYPATVEILPDWKGNAGAYYVAYGEPARDCAERALSAWHTHMPGVPAALAGSKPLGGEDVFIEQPDADIGGRIAKISIDALAPNDWTYVLYMDADTELAADVSYLFQALADGWELVICKNPSRFHIMSNAYRPDNHDEIDETIEFMGGGELMQLNGGVFAYRRCDRTRRFFERWRAEWERYGKRDQAALLRALYAEPLRVLVLGNEWNTVTRYDSPDKSAGILHHPMEARRYVGRTQGRLDSDEAWALVKKTERAKREKAK